MAKKEFTYYGKSVDELKKMSIDDFAKITTSRIRRSLKRGLTEAEKKLVKSIQVKDNSETHCREMPILPLMVGKTVKVHNGKDFFPVRIEAEMLGHTLGEFAMTRKKVAHNAPGIGATKSSASISVK